MESDISNDTTSYDSKILINPNHNQDEIHEEELEFEDPDYVQWLLDKMWTDKYGDITRDELSRQLCLQKAIKNDPDFYSENVEYLKITLGESYPVYCRGKINDTYHVFRIYIFAALTNNLSGPHFVSVENNEPFWVHSLTALRKRFLQFEDFVSFERSSFITFEAAELTPVRLKMLRYNICIPTTEKPCRVYTAPNTYYEFNHSNHQKETSTELSPRSSMQIQRMIFNIKQIYHRDHVSIPSFLNLN